MMIRFSYRWKFRDTVYEGVKACVDEGALAAHLARLGGELVEIIARQTLPEPSTAPDSPVVLPPAASEALSKGYSRVCMRCGTSYDATWKSCLLCDLPLREVSSKGAVFAAGSGAGAVPRGTFAISSLVKERVLPPREPVVKRFVRWVRGLPWERYRAVLRRYVARPLDRRISAVCFVVAAIGFFSLWGMLRVPPQPALTNESVSMDTVKDMWHAYTFAGEVLAYHHGWVMGLIGLCGFLRVSSLGVVPWIQAALLLSVLFCGVGCFFRRDRARGVLLWIVRILFALFIPGYGAHVSLTRLYDHTGYAAYNPVNPVTMGLPTFLGYWVLPMAFLFFLHSFFSSPQVKELFPDTGPAGQRVKTDGF